MEKEKVFAKNIKEIIDIGQNINVEILNGDYKGIYYSYVYDEDNDSFLILLPTDNFGRVGIVKVGDTISIICISKQNMRVGFDSKILQILKNSDKALYKIAKPTEFYKYEFRENFRVNVSLNAKFFYYNSNKQLKTKQAWVINLSASGAKISLNEFLELNNTIVIEFTLENKVFNINAVIVRRLQIDKSTYHYGVRFEEINQKDKDFLIKFCLKKQMEILRMQRG